ncbi:MAG: hypothetical protein ACLTKH_07235 [Eubacterium sp.]
MQDSRSYAKEYAKNSIQSNRRRNEALADEAKKLAEEENKKLKKKNKS